MRILGAALACAILLASSPAAQAAARPLHIRVNGQEVALPLPPDVQDGVIVAALEPVLRAFGATVLWDPRSGVMTVTGRDGTTVRLTAGTPQVVGDRQTQVLPLAPRTEGGMLVGPVAALLRLLRAYVRIDEDSGILEAVSQVTAVTWRRDGGTVAATVSTTGPVRARATVLPNPQRLVVDLEAAVSRPAASVLEGTGPILRVRLAQFQVRPYVTRVVFDLAQPLPYTVTTGASGITVTFASPEPTASAPPPPAAAAQPPPVSAPSGPPPSGPFEVAPEPLALPPLPEFADRPGAFHVLGASYDEDGGSPRIVISASQPFSYQVHEFVFPDRLAVDIPGGVFLPRRRDIEVGSDLVRNIVIVQLQLHPNVVRVLVHMTGRPIYRVRPADGGRELAVTLGIAGGREAPGVPGRASDGLGPGSGERRRPQPQTVIVDPGHGGADVGAVGPTGLHESDVTLAIAKRVEEALHRRGVPVALTRTQDSTVPLEERPDLAQRYGGVLFVSIHANASRDPTVTGTETYYKTPESQPLAALVQSELVKALGEPDRGVRRADFYVLVNTPMPAVLVEVAFISNPREEAMLRDPAVQQRAADAIARAVARFLATYAPAAQGDAAP